MERRSFLKGLVAAPVVAKTIHIEEAVASEPVEPVMYEYGNFGILEISVVSAEGGLAEATVLDPQWDWMEMRESTHLFTYQHNLHPWLHGNRPTKHPPTIVVPVNELSMVEFYWDGELVTRERPKWKDDRFVPWEFTKIWSIQ